jgi:uncharacterized protein
MGPVQVRASWYFDDPRKPMAKASDKDALIEWVNGTNASRVVVGYQDAMLATAFPGQYAARMIAAAANDWSLEQLQVDERFYGLVMVSTALPEEAAAEIRRVGANERMVGVALGANALGRPFGDPLYHPIYAAASELGLPLVLQVGSDAASSLESPPLAGGLPSTFSEYHSLGAQSHMSHVASLICQSVFDQFPKLKVLLVGGGLTWVPSFLWRLDYWYKMAPNDAPWIKALPSTYFERHCRMTTFSLENAVATDRLLRALDTIPDIENCLLYASGYPSADAVGAAEAVERLPETWRPKVLHENAARFFRWPDHPGVSDAERSLAAANLLDLPAEAATRASSHL